MFAHGMIGRPARRSRRTVEGMTGSQAPVRATQAPVVALSAARGLRRREVLWREAVGDVLREERLDRAERIVDVARRAAIAPQYLSEIERGRKDPSSEVLAAAAQALELTVREVAVRAGSRLARGTVSLSSGPLCLAA